MNIEELYTLYSIHFLVDTDTRSIRHNTIFFALKGTHFNGNTFASEALKKGASYAIIDEKEYQTHSNIILVDNVLETLQQLAVYHRKKLAIPILALTGSNGKTTSKELIAAVLSTKFNITATKGNLNNHIGVPLTLLSMNRNTEVGIVEMGANHQKEIEFLCSLVLPDYGYITNFGKAHLEGFGGVEGVIKGKSELYVHLAKNHKIAFINPSDPIQLENTKSIKTVCFDSAAILFKGANPFVNIEYKHSEIQSKLIGHYNFSNIAAAITIGEYFKIELKEIKRAIETYIPSNNRSQIIKTTSHTIILDAYNANPSSMEVAIENFVNMKASSKVVILGDMFELGKDSNKEHQRIVTLVENSNFDSVFFIGEHFNKTTTKFPKFINFEAFKMAIKNDEFSSQTILIKGSRGMQLERIVEILT